MVITVEMYKEIRQMKQRGMSQRQIASQLQISRNTVRKYCDGDKVPWERQPYQRSRSVITEDTLKFIRNCLDEDETEGVRKQYHTAKRIYDRLVEEQDFTGGESTVRGVVRELRQKSAEVFIPLSFPPGEAMQIDWGEAKVYLQGKKITVNLFCARVCSSCAPFVVVYRRQNEESFLEALVLAFEYFGGVPRQVIFDNGKVAVKDGFGAHARKQQGYSMLSSHYGYDAVFCNIKAGNEKGLVEGLVGYIRRNVCVPIPRVTSISELNEQFLQKCRSYGNHRIRGKEGTVAQMLVEEQKHLIPLPGYRYDPAKRTHARVSNFCTIRYDSNDYSVPAKYCGREVTVKAGAEKITVFYEGNAIAEHIRCYERKKSIYELAHYLPILERKGRAIFFAKPVKENVSEEFLAWLKKQALEPKALCRCLRQYLDYGAEAVMSGDISSAETPVISDTVSVNNTDLSAYDRLSHARGCAV